MTLNSVAGTAGELGTTVSGTGNVTEDDTAPVIPGDVVSAVNAGGSTAIDGTAFGFTGTFETDTAANPNPVFTSFQYRIRQTIAARMMPRVFVGDLPNEVFFSERWAANLEYDLALEDGQYIVELYFAETYLGLPGGGSNGGTVGDRLFDVAIEGEIVIDNIDLFDEGDGDHRKWSRPTGCPDRQNLRGGCHRWESRHRFHGCRRQCQNQRHYRARSR